MNSTVSLSIILPCYNPGPDWVAQVLKATQSIAEKVTDFELIVVNDGSKQKQVLENLQTNYKVSALRLINLSKNMGKGHALRQGVAVANGPIIIYTDIDFPYAIESLMKIHALLYQNTADVAIGIRGESYYRHLPSMRIRISKLLRALIKMLLRIPTDDTQCGLKGFNQVGREVFLSTTIQRYLFDLEFIFLAAQKNLRIATEEVQLRPDVILSKMNWKILFQESVNFLKIFIQSILQQLKSGT